MSYPEHVPCEDGAAKWSEKTKSIKPNEQKRRSGPTGAKAGSNGLLEARQGRDKETKRVRKGPIKAESMMAVG